MIVEANNQSKLGKSRKNKDKSLTAKTGEYMLISFLLDAYYLEGIGGENQHFVILEKMFFLEKIDEILINFAIFLRKNVSYEEWWKNGTQCCNSFLLMWLKI